jgi:sugar (pentulose or hexulose) kinase
LGPRATQKALNYCIIGIFLSKVSIKGLLYNAKGESMKINKDNNHPHHEDHEHNKEMKKEARSYWFSMMESTRRAMSRGAQNILKILTSAHGDNWRRKEKKK